MKKTILVMLIIGMVGALTALSLTGCDNDGGSSGGGTNGTWTSTTSISGNEHTGYELQIRNGNWEAKYNGSLEAKGTANDGIGTITHVHGNYFIRFNLSQNCESIWYSQDEAQTLGVNNIGIYFDTFTYSVDGDILTWGQIIYIKK